MDYTILKRLVMNSVRQRFVESDMLLFKNKLRA